LLLRRTDKDVTHFLLTSFWDSVESIRRFAGEDYTQARYYDEDDDFLLEREPLVTHYDVVVAPHVGKRKHRSDTDAHG
jgi:heme-degrading monooxygenase HmoA